MEILPVTNKAISEAVDIIRSGGIVAHATETCYGLACDLTNEKAVKKLYALKNLPEDRNVSALFCSVDDAKKLVEWNAKAQGLAEKHLPGPLTLILPRKETGTIGIRISPHPVAQKLAEGCGVPLSSTSANLHGQANPYSAEDIQNQFKDRQLQPDLILDSGLLPDSPPSTVAHIDGEEVKILRQGSIQI